MKLERHSGAARRGRSGSEAGLFERLLGRASGGVEETTLEEALRRHFRFLEEHQGFELAESKPLPEGAAVAYRNRPAGRGVVVFAREGRGAWAGIGSLDEHGRVRPVSREALERGEWRELQRVDLGPHVQTLDHALAGLARALGGRDG